jgi:ketosteroid isomerase-like protein
MKIASMLSSLIFLLPLTTSASDAQDVNALHNAWINAFEGADIAAVDALWTHTPDATLITLLGVKIKGWQQVRGEIKTTFDLTGKTTITGENLVITISGDTASATMDYRWSPQPNLNRKATEYYRKLSDVWKMEAQDGIGSLPPLRPNDEDRLRQIVNHTQTALMDQNIDAIEAEISPDFTYVAINGTVYRELNRDAIGKDVAQIQDLHLQVIYLTNNIATAHYTLTAANLDDREIRLAYNDNWELKSINFSPKDSLAVDSIGKTATQWARIKAPSPD